MITQTINLNLIPDQAPVVVHVSQYDIGNNRLIAVLYDGDTPYTPPSGATATIQGTKPDRFGFQYDCTISGSTVTASITEQMTAVAGRYPANIIVYEGTQRIGTFNFWIDVQKAALGDDTVISDSDGNIYDIPDLVERAEEAAGQAVERVEEAEAWAVGTKDGTPVPPTDETYHNNSKYYSEQAESRVEDSEAWAVGERGGTAVPSTDETYHNNSKYYAGQAEDRVEDSEAWAVGERGGMAVPSTDETYHNNSKFYADKAADIVDEANYLIGVDPTAIQTPTTPYLRPSDVVNNLTSTATDKPLSAAQGKALKDLIDAGGNGIHVIEDSFTLYASYSDMFDDIPMSSIGIRANNEIEVFVKLPISRDDKDKIISVINRKGDKNEIMAGCDIDRNWSYSYLKITLVNATPSSVSMTPATIYLRIAYFD